MNNKSLFIENQENLLESEKQNIEKANLYIEQIKKENNNLKIQINNLIQQNQQLQNEMLNYKQIFINIQSNQNMPQNNNIMIINPNNNQNNNNINNYNTQKNKVPEPIKLYKKPTLIGLNNIGATCFMNATLQCLSQTEALTNYFLKDIYRNRIINNNIAQKNKNANQLSPVYLELIKELWNANGPKSFSPYNFMNKVNDMNELFKKGQAGDAKDFIIFILEQLHTELKQPIKSNEKNEINNVPLNQYDKINAFNNFFEEFKKETSIMTDIFFGFNETTNVCLYCKNVYNSKGMENPICYNYGVFNVLIFPLEEVKNMKMNILKQNNIHISQNDQVNLYECFSYNEKTDLFTGDNKNFCNICKQLYDSNYTSKIFISPNVLIIILNRGKGNIYKVKLDFKENIDITDFVLQKDKPRIKYNLYGVITHLGESGPNAHFIASCKSPVDGKWYRYNDAFVDPINNFQKEVYDYGIPYILFYQKVQ